MTEDMNQHSGQITDRRSPGSTMERHASSVGIAIIIAILLWVGNSILKQGTQQGVMSGDIRVMASKIENLQAIISSASADRYTSTQANRAKDESDRRFSRLETRVGHIETFILENSK